MKSDPNSLVGAVNLIGYYAVKLLLIASGVLMTHLHGGAWWLLIALALMF